ncbi:MAG: hypothetical protein IKY16_10745 [Bacteroidales bacterium]|nr:hypothetical protein [Bacteroidales bacterium]
MNIREIVMMITSVIIGIIVVSAVMIPIVDSSSEKVVSVGNNTTAYYVSDTKVNESLTFTCNPSTDEFFINGVSFDWLSGDSGIYYRQVFVFTNAVAISFGPLHEAMTFSSPDFPEFGTTGAATSLTINPDGTWSATVNSRSIEGVTPVDWIFYPSTSGTYGCFALDFNVTEGKEAYILSGTKVVNYDGGSGNATLFARATVVDGVLTTDYAKVIQSSGVTDVDVNFTLPNNVEEDGYWHYESGYWGATGIVEATASNVMFAPIEFEYISESDGVVRTLLNILPIFTIIGLLVGVVSVMYFRRT